MGLLEGRRLVALLVATLLGGLQLARADVTLIVSVNQAPQLNYQWTAPTLSISPSSIQLPSGGGPATATVYYSLNRQVATSYLSGTVSVYNDGSSSVDIRSLSVTAAGPGGTNSVPTSCFYSTCTITAGSTNSYFFSGLQVPTANLNQQGSSGVFSFNVQAGASIVRGPGSLNSDTTQVTPSVVGATASVSGPIRVNGGAALVISGNRFDPSYQANQGSETGSFVISIAASDPNQRGVTDQISMQLTFLNAGTASTSSSTATASVVLPERLPTPAVSLTVSSTQGFCNYGWGVALAAGDNSYSATVAAALQVPYKLQVTRTLQGVAYYVSGTVQVTNPSSTVALPLGSGHTVDVGGIVVGIACPSSIAPGATVTCTPAGGNGVTGGLTFNATYPSGPTAGQATARIVTTGSTGTASSMPTSFTFPSTLVCSGECAMLVESCTAPYCPSSISNGSSPSFGAADADAGSIANPPGVRVCDTRTYTYAASYNFWVGDASYCGAAPPVAVSRTATLTPAPGAPQGPVTSKADVAIAVAPCVAAALGDLSAGALRTYTWGLSKGLVSPTPAMVTYDKPATLTYAVNANRVVGGTSYSISGSLVVGNPAAATKALGVESATLVMTGPSSGRVPTPLTCTDAAAIKPGASASCAFNVTYPDGPMAGTVTASVTFSGAGKGAASTGTQPLPAFPSQPDAAGACAVLTDDFTPETLQAFPGLTTPLSAASGGMPLCDSNTVVYNVTVPPRGQGYCATYKLSNGAVLDPKGGTQASLRVTQVSELVVTGCSETTTPMDLPDDKVPLLVVSVASATVAQATWYSWSTSNVMKPSADVGVVVAAGGATTSAVYSTGVYRSAPRSAPIVQGSVLLSTNNTSQDLELRQVIVQVQQDGGAPPASALAYCPTKILRRARSRGQTSSISCDYVVKLSPNATRGVVRASATITTSATVFTSSPGGSSANNRGCNSGSARCFDVRRAPAITLGSCVNITSQQYVDTTPRSLPKFVSGDRPPPSRGTVICASKAFTSTLQFGPYTTAQCGTYTAHYLLSAVPTNGSAALVQPVTMDKAAPLKVTGCTPSTGRRLLQR